MYLDKAYLKPDREDSKLEGDLRADLMPEGADLRSERADLRLERSASKPVGSWEAEEAR